MWVRLSEHGTVWQCPQGSDQPLDKVGNMSVKAVDRYQKHTRYQRLLFKGQQGYTFLSKYMTFLKSQQIVLTLTLQFLLFATLAKNLTVGPLAKNAILLLVSLSPVLTLFLLLFSTTYRFMSIDRQSTATKREVVLSVLFPYKCNFHSHECSTSQRCRYNIVCTISVKSTLLEKERFM